MGIIQTTMDEEAKEGLKNFGAKCLLYAFSAAFVLLIGTVLENSCESEKVEWDNPYKGSAEQASDIQFADSLIKADKRRHGW